MKKRAQQEIVGFVLIVALVMVALMVFLVISLRTQPTERESIEVENLLNSIMKKTTGCAISFEPQYDDFEDLFKSCYNEDTCNNIQENGMNLFSCEYLQESLNETIRELLTTEATTNSFQLDFLNREDEEEERIFRISEGNCTGQVSSAQKTLLSDSDKLIIRMRICNN